MGACGACISGESTWDLQEGLAAGFTYLTSLMTLFADQPLLASLQIGVFPSLGVPRILKAPFPFHPPLAPYSKDNDKSRYEDQRLSFQPKKGV